MEILNTYQTLISGLIGAIITYIIFKTQQDKKEKKDRYDRIFWIYRSLLSNFPQIVCVEFVAAFNMILVEFEKDKEVLDARNKFLDFVKNVPIDDKKALEINIQDRDDSLIRLINLIGKRIDINVEQLDIKNKIYWPQGFIDTASQQQKLMNLLLNTQEGEGKLLEKINKNQFSIGVYPVQPENKE